jgi:hypothetical protein
VPRPWNASEYHEIWPDLSVLILDSTATRLILMVIDGVVALEALDDLRGRGRGSRLKFEVRGKNIHARVT